MDLIRLLRAKSEREGEEGRNILLVDHIIETLNRAKQLKDFVEANADTITYSDFKDEKFFTALAIALILHDFGKINYDFQKRVHGKESDGWKELRDFLKPIREIKLRHEILSAIWASIVLEDTDEWKDWFPKIRTAVLLHHYNEYYVGMKDLTETAHNHFEDMKKYVEFIVNNQQRFEEFLSDVVNQVHDKFAGCNFIENALKIIRNCELKRVETLLEMIENREDDLSEFAEFYEIDNENPDYEFLVFLGCLRRCDYSASGEVDLEKMDENKKTTIKLKELYKDLDEKIKRKIGREPDWQKMILEKLEPLKSVVLIAPTGAGKTEFALLWNTKNKRKLIYTLPLRVALNDLFHRFKDHYFDKNSIDILHSTAFIEYLEEEQKGKRQVNVEKQLTASKLLSSPILLTTPDQVFLTSLNYYGSDKVIAVYPLSSIVIDEIQAYDPEMASIIIRTLKIVENLKGTVLIMTATLPPYFEPFFFKDKSKDYEIPEEFRLNFERIDTRDIGNYVKNYNLKRHKIDLVNDWLINYIIKKDGRYSIEVNKRLLNEYLEKYKGKNVFVVLNNVSKAIEIYKQLKKDKYSNVFLLHSRLIEKEKDKRINEVKELLRKNERVVVVATQIIEASVDLDFDVMLTEVSPIDSQVQRWGRVYRNREKDYDEELPNILVFVGKYENGEIKIDRGTSAIYDKRVVEKTVEVLENYKGRVLSYEDEKKMIDEVFEKAIDINDPEIAKEINRENIKLKDLYVAEIKRNLDFLKYFSVEKKHQAQRLFRRIAGIQVIIPAVMRIDGDEIVKSFAEIVENPESDKLTWDEIKEKVGADKWTLRKMLYLYSVSIPIFYWEDLSQLIKHEFKGFYVLKISEKEAENVLEYGIDEMLKKSEEEYLEGNVL